MKSKNYIWLGLIIGMIAIPLAAQTRRSETAKGARAQGTRPSLSAAMPSPTPQSSPATQALTASQRSAALNTSIASTCAETAPANPPVLSHNASVFSNQRVANTLNGIWIGKVSGEYDPQLFAPDGFLNVDYYMIVDINRGESFTYQEFGPKRSGSYLQAQPGASKWTYVWCANETYKTKSPRQVHEFTKVSNNIQDAKALITNSVGVTFAPGETLVLGNVWQKLEASGFFDNPAHSLAYAGVLFNPVTMGNVSSGSGSLFELKLVGEYRGSGQTAAKFATGEPIHNVEQGHFLGISSGIGDFLAASIGLGNAMFGPKPDWDAPLFTIQMLFDKVIIGPLGPNLGTPTGQPSQPTSPANGAVPAKAAAPTKAAPPTKTRAGQRRAHR